MNLQLGGHLEPASPYSDEWHEQFGCKHSRLAFVEVPPPFHKPDAWLPGRGDYDQPVIQQKKAA